MDRIVLGDDPDVKGGVYVLRVGKYFYFGKGRSFKDRRKDHLVKLRANRHKNPILQRAFNKYGEEKTSFEPIVWCNLDDAARLEAELIQKMKPLRECANLRIEDGKSYMASPETRARMSDSQKGRVFAEEHRRKISESLRGRKLSQKSMDRIKAKLRGRRNPGTSTPVLVVTPDNMSLWFVSLRSAAAFLGIKHSPHIGDYIRGKRQPHARLAGYRFSYLDKTRENWSISPTACTHEHYGSTAP